MKERRDEQNRPSLKRRGASGSYEGVHRGILAGSWVVISGAISPPNIGYSYVYLLIATMNLQVGALIIAFFLFFFVFVFCFFFFFGGGGWVLNNK